jgi:DnaJ-domain-containing protein 1
MRRKKEPQNISDQLCEWEGCEEHAEHRAPKEAVEEDLPPTKRDWHWFCLKHVREYNKAWNFFNDMQMDDEAAQKYQRDAVHGHRKTWRMGWNAKKQIKAETYWKTRDAFEAFVEDIFEDMGTPKDADLNRPKEERDALGVLELSYPVTQAEIKSRYKKLVKKHHPDANPEDPKAEDRFKVISEAYHFLKNSSYFPT